MLKSKSVAKLIQTTLNMNDSEKFRVVYEVGGYKGADINCILKQGKGTIRPILNYTNVNTPFTLEIIVPTGCGEDRIDDIVDIVNGVIGELNGKVKNIDNGKAVFLFSPLEIGQYDTRATAGQSVIMKMDFVVEYSSKSGTKYEMALITTPFEYGTQNARRFETEEEKEEWINARLSDAPFYEVLSPNINSLTITQQRYLNPRSVDINDLSMFNYAVIKETKWNDEVNYYFYYVTNANIDQYNTLVVDLQMDTLQTFYNKIEFGDCVIDRYHINRWKENTDNTVSFDGESSSDLFETDGIDLPKRLVSRKKLKVQHTSKTKINDWLNDNVEYWVYVFIDKNHEYTVAKNDGKSMVSTRTNYSQLIYRKNGDNVAEEYGVVAYPVFKTNANIIVKVGDIEFKINYQGLNNFRNNNTDASYFYGVKYSLVCPIDFDTYITGFSFDIVGEDLVITDTVSGNYGYGTISTYFKLVRTSDIPSTGTVRTEYGLVMGFSQEVKDLDTEDYTLGIETTFEKQEITRSNRNPKFNPKLLSQHYRNLKITTSSGEEFDYDVQKLNSKTMSFLYTEPIQSEITRYYYRVKAPIGLYVEESNKNYLGLVGSVDNSRVYANTQYAQFLANNKNFFLQNSKNRGAELGFGLGQGVFSAVMGAVQGAFFTGGNPIGAVVGASTSVAQTVTSAIKSNTTAKRNENYTIDNMKSSPSLLNNANGSVIFNNFVTEMGLYVEEHEALENEIKDSDDYMFMNGYTFGRMHNIKEVDNIRHYFNFVQAQVDSIIGNISEPIREDIRQRFANGVRFWNTDNIDYTMENYERWLNNEL